MQYISIDQPSLQTSPLPPMSIFYRLVWDKPITLQLSRTLWTKRDIFYLSEYISKGLVWSIHVCVYIQTILSIFLRDKSVVSFICINPERGNFEDFPRIKHVFTFLVLLTYITHHCIKRNRVHTISINLSLKPIVWQVSTHKKQHDDPLLPARPPPKLEGGASSQVGPRGQERGARGG